MMLGGIGLVLIVISFIIEILSEKIHPIAWGASFFVMSSVVYWRFYVIDKDKFTQFIRSTNPDTSYQLNPHRFYNCFPVVFVLGLAATIIIYYDFIVGVLTYLLMQLSLIIAFSGIFITDIRYLWRKQGNLTTLSKISAGFWSILIGILYLLVYNGS